MINARGKSRHQSLALTARDAARRFVPRRLSRKGRRNPWRPIVLRWRQRFRRPASAAADKAALPASFLSFPRFHLHLVTYFGDRAQKARLAGAPPPAVIQQERVVVNPIWTSAGRSTRVFQACRVHRPMRAVDSHKNSWSQDHARAPAAPGISWRRAVSPLVRWVAHGPRGQFFGRMPEKGGANTLRIERTQLFAGRLRTRERWLPVFAARVLTPSKSIADRSTVGKRLPLHLVFPERLTRGSAQQSPRVMASNGRHAKRRESFQEPQHSTERRRLQVQLERVEELVWRRGLRSPTVAEECGREAQRAESHHRPPVRSIPSHEAAQAESPAVVGAAALPAAKLDPALLDRLTDDVIRRVEQRIRIDRQRRGL